jgi:hypothetical protein
VAERIGDVEEVVSALNARGTAMTLFDFEARGEEAGLYRVRAAAGPECKRVRRRQGVQA